VDCQVTVVVDADAPATWDRLADLGGWPAWNPSCVGARARGEMAPGTALELHLRHPRGRDFWTRPTLAEVTPPHRLGWRAGALGLRADTSIELTPEQEGTRVTLTSSSRGPMGFAYRMAMRPRTQAAMYTLMLDGLARSFR
jgi:uncharacterized protein YndB with AHSA1/START domain